MKKLLIIVFITTLSFTSSFAQTMISSDVGLLKPFVSNKNTPSDFQSFKVYVTNPTNQNVTIYISPPYGFELSFYSDFINSDISLSCPISMFSKINNDFYENTFYIRVASTALVGKFQRQFTVSSSSGSYPENTNINWEVKGVINTLPVLNNSISTYITTDFTRGRNTTTGCKTSATDANTIDVFCPFIANNSTSSLDLTVGNPSWLSTMELVDTVNYSSISTCQNNIGVGQSLRTYNFTGLTVGQKYIVRLELGDSAPLGHARLETINNTFNLKLLGNVTAIDSENVTQSKTISVIYNLQGVEVSTDYQGLVIYKYNDGSTQKVIQ